MSVPLAVLSQPEHLSAALPPLRRQLLTALAEPDSAAGLARRLGLPRQKVNYHLRELEKAGLIALVDERQRRGCTERILQATARQHLVDPAVLGELNLAGVDRDRFSSAWLIMQAAKLVHDVATLRARAEAVEQKLLTFTLESDLGFETPQHLGGFLEELTGAVASLSAKYGASPSADGARRYRFLLGGHPTLTKKPEQAAAEAAAHQRPLDQEPDRD